MMTGVLLVAAFMSQMEAAAARSVRTAARAPHPVNRQLQDSAGSRAERQGVSAPTGAQSKSCDIFWCYGK
jgi:hypothetical protein